MTEEPLRSAREASGRRLGSPEASSSGTAPKLSRIFKSYSRHELWIEDGEFRNEFTIGGDRLEGRNSAAGSDETTFKRRIRSRKQRTEQPLFEWQRAVVSTKLHDLMIRFLHVSDLARSLASAKRSFGRLICLLGDVNANNRIRFGFCLAQAQARAPAEVPVMTQTTVCYPAIRRSRVRVGPSLARRVASHGSSSGDDTDNLKFAPRTFSADFRSGRRGRISRCRERIVDLLTSFPEDPSRADLTSSAHRLLRVFCFLYFVSCLFLLSRLESSRLRLVTILTGLTKLNLRAFS